MVRSFVHPLATTTRCDGDDVGSGIAGSYQNQPITIRPLRMTPAQASNDDPLLITHTDGPMTCLAVVAAGKRIDGERVSREAWTSSTRDSLGQGFDLHATSAFRWYDWPASSLHRMLWAWSRLAGTAARPPAPGAVGAPVAAVAQPAVPSQRTKLRTAGSSRRAGSTTIQ